VNLVQVLAAVDRHGVELSVSGGHIRWRCSGELPAVLRDLILEHKAALLRLLECRAAPWSEQAEAEALLAEHRQELVRLEHVLHRGRFPPIVATLVADGLTIAERYIRDHALEQARGYDPLELLCGIIAQNLRLARNGGKTTSGLGTDKHRRNT